MVWTRRQSKWSGAVVSELDAVRAFIAYRTHLSHHITEEWEPRRYADLADAAIAGLEAENEQLKGMLEEAARVIVSLRGAYMPIGRVIADLAVRYEEREK